MDDDESGGSDFNSSDGGSGSWSPSPSHRANQHVPNREGGYGRMEPKQLLSNDFYTRQFAQQRPEDSDENFEEESDEEGDKLEVQRQHQGHVGVDREDGGLESDYDGESDYNGVYEETQLLEQYNAAHYSKVDHEEKLRCREQAELPYSTDNNRQKLRAKPAYEETQLLENYDFGAHGHAQHEKGGNSRDLQTLQHEKVDSDAETADEGEPTEAVESDASSEDEATTSRQDQQEGAWKEKPNSRFRQERMCEFDMDLNVSLEEEMDCEYYGEPRNYNSQVVHTETQLVQNTEAQSVPNIETQLVPNTETQLVCDTFRGWQCDTQLVSTTGKEFLDNISTSYTKAAATDAKELPYAANPSSSFCRELPSLTTESKLKAIPSASEASEGSPFQSCVGTIHAESMRMAAMQPLTWFPKVKLDDHIFRSSKSYPLFRNRREAGKSDHRGEHFSCEPEWMRDYGSKGDSSMKKNLVEIIGAPVLSSGQEFAVSKDNKLSGMLSSVQGDATEQVWNKGRGDSLFGTSNTPGSSYKGTTGKTGIGSRFLQIESALPRRSSFGPRLPSPTGSMNYLDSMEPGDEVQAQALDMVDKLVWLNTADATPESPPRKYKKSFSGLPPASSTLTNPALQVFEFEDTPLTKGEKTYGDLSLIKEIQAGWKKKAEQNHLALTARKGKEKEAASLPEGERLSKLLTESDLDKICEPRLPFDGATTKRLSAKLQGKSDGSPDAASAKSSPFAQERVTGFRGDNASNETRKLRGNLAEHVEVTDDDLLNVVGIGKQRPRRGVKLDELVEQNRDQGEGEGKVLDGAQVLTRRRSQVTRNRRENIRVPGSPEGTSLMDGEMENNPSTSRKRRSLNYMLRDRNPKKARSMVEEDEEEDQNEQDEEDENEEVEEDENEEEEEDQNEANENMDSVPSSPASSDADPTVRLVGTTSVERSGSHSKQLAERSIPHQVLNAKLENVEGEAEIMDQHFTDEVPAKGKKRRRNLEVLKLLAGDDIGDILDDGVKTRSLRQLRRRGNDDKRTEPFSSALVQKRLRSVRRGSGGMQGVPKISTVDDECDLRNEVEQDPSTSTWSAAFQGDSDDEEQEVNDVSSPETSDQGDIHIDLPLANADVGRSRMTRTRSIADVSSPPTPVLQPVPFPLVTGRRGRGAVVKPEIVEECPNPSFVLPPAGKGLRMRTVRKRRDPQMLAGPSEDLMEFVPERSASVSTEGSLRTRRGTNVSVLFSHGLSEDTMKKQRKIVERLDGKVTKKAADCTHFVAEKFVRTGNMLEAMAAGKFVVTFAWLENCQLANCFVEERNFLLQDEKKERELGFSMRATILAAQHRPLLQGVRILLTPNINPKPQAIAAIVQAAGGQVVEDYEGPAPDGQNEGFCIVIANEEDLGICVPFLDQGAKVYKSELILSGIISHHLDFSKHILFENYRSGRRRGRLT
ncbi:hypothetical protein KC19_2G275700 [Ceratodon purpureus]|uniref:BRCT domain-containing protein n=1 Tax=Ceratodon purpureus TaxID=3225 RepID=A0A8T0J2H5_CERPU|nr:hypothetical protein KC19_2G275700 [Ceratodon purpureus]